MTLSAAPLWAIFAAKSRSHKMSAEHLSQALKEPHAPETAAAGLGADMTIVLKVLGLDIIAGRQGAGMTEGIVIINHLLAEGAKIGVIPDLLQTALAQLAERARLHLLLPATGVTAIAVPQE